MKILYLTLLLSLSFSLVQAQSNYKPGYIINNNKDTVKGFIDYHEWTSNPRSIRFKPSMSATPANYTVNTATEFEVNNVEYYKAFAVRVSKSPVEFSALAHQIDTSYNTDTVFLKSIVKGLHISLYSFTDNVKTRYYLFDNKTHQIDELKYNLYLDDETNSVVTSARYQEQLLNYEVANGQTIGDKLLKRIRSLQYKEGDLVKIFTEINGGAAQQTSHGTFGSRFFAGLSAKRNTLAFHGADGPFSDGFSVSNISPAVSAGVDFFGNVNTKEFFFRAEIAAASSNFNLSEESNGVLSKLDFKQYLFSFVPQVIYNFYNTDNLKVFIGGGVGLNFATYGNYNYTSSVKGIPYEQNKFPQFEKFYFSIPVKAGVFVNKNLEIYGAYSLPSTITNYVYFSSRISSVQAGVNYLFGKK